VQVHPQKFRFVENVGKIPENVGKIPENLVKVEANVLLFEKNGVFWRSGITVFMRKYSHKKWPKFFWQVSEIRTKILRTPINLPAPTPMAANS